MTRVLLASLGLVTLACAAGSPEPVVSEAPTSATTPARTEGLALELRGAPAGVSIEILASDDRKPLVDARALREAEIFELEEGFVRLVLRGGEGERREIQLYLRPGASVRYDWERGLVELEGATLLDRQEAELQWARDLEALMRAHAAWQGEGELPAELIELIASQRRAIEAGGDSPQADLLRLRHAAFVAQLTGPEDGWAVVATVAPDSIAWAAYAPWLTELVWLLRELPEAGEHFAAVREQIPDRGLQSAFRALDLSAAARSDAPDALADAYLEASEVAGPVVVGEAMPAFELRGVDAQVEISSESLRGTAYLVEVWSTWCKPCIASMAELHDLHAALAELEPGLRILSVAIDDSRAPVELFRRERWPMPWLNAWVPGGEPLSSWGVEGVPYVLLVDAQGQVVAAGRSVERELILDTARR